MNPNRFEPNTENSRKINSASAFNMSEVSPLGNYPRDEFKLPETNLIERGQNYIMADLNTKWTAISGNCS